MHAAIKVTPARGQFLKDDFYEKDLNGLIEIMKSEASALNVGFESPDMQKSILEQLGPIISKPTSKYFTFKSEALLA